MPRLTLAHWIAALLLAALAGCADNPLVLKGRVAQVEQQQANLTRQNQLYQDRAPSWTATTRDWRPRWPRRGSKRR